ncbi:hypothetical protein C8R42DRAFT_550517, partial [Lentinula raphanica]
RQIKAPKPKLGPLPWTDNDNAKVWELIGLLESSENRVLLGTRKGQKTLGETKAHAERRIAELLFPEDSRIDLSTVQNRVHGKIASLTQSYRKHAKKLKSTGNGVREDEEDAENQEGDEEKEKDEDEEELDVLAGDVHLKWYIGSEGPTDETPEKAKNLWASIVKKFPFFPRLHSL